ncbi:hypothetical protein GYH30_018061 [Glycine max]|uniref:Uncharacterized protein n=1 Tax=Glycine max TaxID=3847 RepID=K7L197_SOYBN|nr:hypothetical protein GYH30_018061 [Glycine max]
MVVYTSLIASNIFNQVIKYSGNWKIFKFNDDAKDMDGFNRSGVIILQRASNYLKALNESATTNIVEEKNEDTQKDMSRKIGSKKYAALRTNFNEEVSSKDLTQERESMMHGFKSLRSNIDSKGFLPLSNAQGSTLNSKSSSESLDDIFDRLKRPPSEYRDSDD